MSTGGGCNIGSDKLSSTVQTILAKKRALASEYADVRAGRITYAAFQRDMRAFAAEYGGAGRLTQAAITPCVPDPDTGQCPTNSSANYVDLHQQPQATTYYCGPATASEVLGVRGVSKSQSFLAGSSYLGTDSRGETPWNPYVMHATLNKVLGSNWYVPVDGAGVGGGFSTTTWQNDLKLDIDNGYAIAGNIVEYKDTDPHLIGHPRSLTIYHWIGIYGYTNYGSNNTKYADSISGTVKLWPWAANVPPYSGIPSSTMTTLLNERGFVW